MIAYRTCQMESGMLPLPNGVNLFYRTYGNSDADLQIVYVHGALQSLHSFELMAMMLAEHYFVVAFDLPGHGRSSALPTTVADSLAADCLHSVIDHCHLDNIILSGWSFGGLVLHNYLGLYGAAHIRGLMLMDSLFGGFSAINQYFAHVGQMLPAESFGTILGFDLHDIASAHGRDDHSTFEQRIVAFEQLMPLLSKATLPEAMESQRYAENARAFLHLQCVDVPAKRAFFLSEVPIDRVMSVVRASRLPTLMIQGADDPLLPPGASKLVADRFPAERVRMVEIPDCGHTPFVEQPLSVLRAMLEFLSDPIITSPRRMA
jgi:pimeloyl-ACP methyl ester carboxylesterase